MRFANRWFHGSASRHEICRARLLASFLALSTLLVAASPRGAQAFDGHRRGFLLGLGLGPTSFVDNSRERFTGLNTDLRVGHGINDRLQLHYSGRQAWLTDNNTVFTTAAPSFGLSLYLSPRTPSPYLTGGGGLMLAGARFAGTPAVIFIGPTFYGGVGLELLPHWSVEISAGVSTLIDADERGTFYDLRLGLAFLAY